MRSALGFTVDPFSGTLIGQKTRDGGRLKAAGAAALGVLGLTMLTATGQAADDELDDISLWDTSINLRGGVGYNDNVLLAHANEQASAFWKSDVEVMIFRLPVDNRQFLFFLSGEDTRYFRDIDTNKEQSLISLARFTQDFDGPWEAGVGIQYVYQNRVFDVSATEADITTIPLEAHSAKVSPSVQRDLGEHWEAELEFPVRRQFFREPLDDYWEGGPEIEARRPYGNRSHWAVTYTFDWRFYDTRNQRDAQGRRLDDTSLQFRRHELELGNRHYWDDDRRWRTQSSIGVQWNVDNGSGYFDYERYFLSQDLRYEMDTWEVRGQARLSYYDYDRQRVGLTDRSKRERTTLRLSLEGERQLWKSLRWFGEVSHEQSISNRGTEEYESSSVVTGLDYGF